MGACLSVFRLKPLLDDVYWKDWSQHPAHKVYDIGDTLGKGGFSEVARAQRKDTKEVVALKIVFLGSRRLSSKHVQVLRDEVNIMRRLHHRNIPRVRNVIEDRARKQIAIEEDMCFGDRLLQELGHVDSNDHSLLAVIMKQIFEALEHIHAMGIVHRDVKPANIVFKQPHHMWGEELPRPMLLDFGMALQLKGSKSAETGVLGSSGYISPETITHGAHSPAMDMFACGVILYVMLTGRKPMTKLEAVQLSYAKCEAANYTNMKEDVLWDAADAGAKDLVLKLLERQPKRRLSATQALAHPWIQKHGLAQAMSDADRELKRARLKVASDEEQLEKLVQLVLQDSDCAVVMRMCEYGFCSLAGRPPTITDVVAAHQYLAPEILQGRAQDNGASDVWSTGVLLYALLLGRFPFSDPTNRSEAVLENILQQQPTFPPDLASGARDLLQGMLHKDPTQRITMDQIKELPWYRGLASRAGLAAGSGSACACASPCVWAVPSAQCRGPVFTVLKEARSAAQSATV